MIIQNLLQDTLISKIKDKEINLKAARETHIFSYQGTLVSDQERVRWYNQSDKNKTKQNFANQKYLTGQIVLPKTESVLPLDLLYKKNWKEFLKPKWKGTN